MYYLFLAAALLLVFVPSFLKRKRAVLIDEDAALLTEYKMRIKQKPLGKIPDELTQEQRKLWSRAISEMKENMNIKVYQIAGILLAILMIILIVAA